MTSHAPGGNGRGRLGFAEVGVTVLIAVEGFENDVVLLVALRKQLKALEKAVGVEATP